MINHNRVINFLRDKYQREMAIINLSVSQGESFGDYTTQLNDLHSKTKILVRCQGVLEGSFDQETKDVASDILTYLVAPYQDEPDYRQTWLERGRGDPSG